MKSLCALLLVAGCGPSIDQACGDIAQAQCAKLDQCKKNGVMITYGDLATCTSRQKAQCLVASGANGSGRTPSDTEDCALSMPAETCQDYLQNNPVPACRIHAGTLALGEPCAFSTQCQSTFCLQLKATACGTCSAPPNPGDPCANNNCNDNQACTTNLLCEPWVGPGGQCDANNTCAPGSWCVTAKTATTGTCQLSLTTVGAACDPGKNTLPGCDQNQGLYCDTVTKVCVAINYANAGQSCGTLQGVQTQCQSGASCYPTTMGMPNACTAASIEGQACDTALGPSCLTPARCVTSNTSTAGTCALLDPTACL